MSKWNCYNEQIVTHLEYNSNNTHIAKKVFPDGNAKEIERLRKHVATIREYGLPTVTDTPIFSGQTFKKHLAIEPYLNGNPDNILINCSRITYDHMTYFRSTTLIFKTQMN